MANPRMVSLAGPICVFCGSNSGRSSAYAASAVKLGSLLAEQGITLVYGGGDAGLMRTVADAALAAGGRVVGVFPKALESLEAAHRRLTELHIVGSMHQRKALMADLAEAFITLPGGFGTLDELSEILTWAQLGMHRKPIGLLNVGQYYDSLLEFFDRSILDRFADPAHRRLLIEAAEPSELLQEISRRQAAWAGLEGDSNKVSPRDST